MIYKKQTKKKKQVVEVGFETSLVYFKVCSLIYCALLISLRFLCIHFIIPINIFYKKSQTEDWSSRCTGTSYLL